MSSFILDLVHVYLVHNILLMDSCSWSDEPINSAHQGMIMSKCSMLVLKKSFSLDLVKFICRNSFKKRICIGIA